MTDDLTGKTAFVTGAGAHHGIGRRVSLHLARAGANVVLSDLAQNETPGLRDTVDEIRAAGGAAIAVTGDISQEAEVQACIDAAVGEFGGLDIVVNNAGSLVGSDAFMATTPAQWTASFQVNLLAPMMIIQAAIPHLQRRGGGVIINIGSTGSLGAEAGFGAYTAMKHGLIGLTKTIAAEFGVDNIRCNAVCPGYIETDMHMAANQRLATQQGVTVQQVKTGRYGPVALRRAGRPDEVADAVLYLCGPGGSYVTGVALPVAGGVPFGI